MPQIPLLAACAGAAMVLMLAAAAPLDAADRASPRSRTVVPAASARPLPPPVPLLWRVSDADNQIYLLGSFHLLGDGDYPLSRDADEAFEDAEALVFELTPEEMASPALGTAMAQAALRTDGTPLDSELPAALASRLRAWAQDNARPLGAAGLGVDTLQIFEPWFAALTVSLVEMGKLGLRSELGLDTHFMTRAAKAGKPATGLEKGSEQIALFQGMSRPEQLQLLTDALDEAADAGDKIQSLHAAWRNGDADALWTGMAADMRRDSPQLYRRMNVARNDAWLPKLRRLLDAETTNDTLVVVGAMHLLGEDGVVEKLRAKGYRVERICSGCVAPELKPDVKPRTRRRR